MEEKYPMYIGGPVPMRTIKKERAHSGVFDEGRQEKYVAKPKVLPQVS